MFRYQNSRAAALSSVLGIVAVLFLALGPALAPVLSTSARNHQGIEICDSFTMMKQAVAHHGMHGHHQPHHPPAHKPGHCLFCNSRQMALLPAPPAIPLPDLSSSFMVVFTTTLLLQWRLFRAYNPRGPPDLS